MSAAQQSSLQRWEARKAFLAKAKAARAKRDSIDGKRKRRETAAKAEAIAVVLAIEAAERRYPVPSVAQLQALRERETDAALSRLVRRFRAGRNTAERDEIRTHLARAILRREQEPAEPTVTIEQVLRDALRACFSDERPRALDGRIPNWLRVPVARKTVFFDSPVGPIPLHHLSDGTYSLDKDDGGWWSPPHRVNRHRDSARLHRAAAPNRYAYEVPIDPLYEAQCALDGIELFAHSGLGAPTRLGNRLTGERCFDNDPFYALLIAASAPSSNRNA